MKLSFSDTALDILFDIYDFLYERKEKLKIFGIIVLLGMGAGLVSAKVLPTTDITTISLIEDEYEQAVQQLASQQEEELHAAAEKEEEVKAVSEKEEELKKEKEFEKTLTESSLEKVYNEAIGMLNISVCKEQLVGKYITECEDQYWNIQASFQKDPKLCSKIQTEKLQTQCISSTKTTTSVAGINTLDDTEIKQKSEQCMSMKTQVNQNVCWNSLYLSVAIQNGDPLKCEQIKNKDTRANCRDKAKATKDSQLLQLALTNKDQSYCDKIEDQTSLKQCYRDTNPLVFVLSAECDENCLTKKVIENAVKLSDAKVCDGTITETGKRECYDTILKTQALASSNSQLCNSISTPSIKAQCVIPASKDKNPDIIKNQFLSGDRPAPLLGQKLQNPFSASLTGSSDFQSFDNIIANSLSQTTTAKIETHVCAAFKSVDERSQCEDSLILQHALPQKDLQACALIHNNETREYCELEIVQQDAIRAADTAKAQCLLLSTQSAQAKCLNIIGFGTGTPATQAAQTIAPSMEEIEKNSAQDCLIFEDPEDRIACMNELSILQTAE
ncbi:hypothetical protein COB57_00570 [Candidatus Peregrinibacteria bacterium]|nr:MAG: hypothetical protein COB57_00570 [Candidatus Peregrinibacteria bacterium]